MIPFWIISGALGLVVVALLVLALLRNRPDGGVADSSDLQVYRDQLREVERDVARGVLAEADAERLRAEISRRILAADAELRATVTATQAPRGVALATAGLILIIVLVGGYGLYSTLGVPGYGDLALRDRIAAADERRKNRPSQIEAEGQLPPLPATDAPKEYLALVDRLRQAVEDRPDDLQGHVLLARSEATLGNFIRAYMAQERIVAIRGDDATARDYADLADMMVLAAGGYVSPEAERVLDGALSRDPNNGVARYYGGLMLQQNDRPDVAFRLWDTLLRASNPDDAWVPPITAQIGELALRAGVTGYQIPDLGGTTLAGPGQDDIAAAENLSPEERQEMIRGMVSQLSDRLASQGGTPEEWARLIGAYGVLGNAEQAIAIWENAQEVFAGNDAALEIVRDGARNANIAP
ncbi:c-type cytochrome biogenesis protein CcmI [Puniceibacterium sp. IMCC21224]|uniref:c-type cytochrome biogenesis protein CcmI n=1 Tax=Puniceibacterium sp. IMCC21224 TaxID=1618204 RepID=UPI00065D2A2C|nr:c-type cytochrome biogenesis protein CcmI [Puniceibacterium sp. IMCC21224]KMK67949.1 cytochrome c-type biogenesis protein CcmI [Puniceibacterium sp. IMCC21224]